MPECYRKRNYTLVDCVPYCTATHIKCAHQDYSQTQVADMFSTETGETKETLPRCTFTALLAEIAEDLAVEERKKLAGIKLTRLK